MQADPVCGKGRGEKQNAGSDAVKGRCRESRKVSHTDKMQPCDGNGDQCGGQFPDDQPDGGDIDGKGYAMLLCVVPEKKNAAHAEGLLEELAEGGKPSLFYAVKIAVIAGMQAGGREGEGGKPQKRGAARFIEQGEGDVIGALIDTGGTGGGKQDGEKGACKQDAQTISVSAIFRFTGDEFGNGALDTGGTQGEGEGEHRIHQFIDAHPFLPEHPGEENAIKKADASAEQACECQDEGSF